MSSDTAIATDTYLSDFRYTEHAAHAKLAAGSNPVMTDQSALFTARYRAVCARDKRFDGQFFTGVHSTGIYCRPSCPAATPKPENVSFYLTAAAAHEAGFRACKRCLPDAAPGSPEWSVRDDLAARAMRLIADGVVERDGVAGLAHKLGYTSRHLSRILTAEIGAGPLAIARVHRAQTARMLLTHTDLRVADIAFASGFGSVRQFNDTVQAVYDRTPAELRARQPGVAAQSHPGVDSNLRIRVRLPARAPFDSAGVFSWLADRTINDVERVTNGEYVRALRLPGGPALLRASLDMATSRNQAPPADTPGIMCDIQLSGAGDLAAMVSRVRHLFDLDADSTAIDAVLATDPLLRARVGQIPGIRVPGCLDPHEMVFRALIGQQISVAGARTALARLSKALGERCHVGGENLLLFPTTEAIAEHAGEILRGPAARTGTIVTVAQQLAAGTLSIGTESPRVELMEQLRAIPGIGEWTSGYLAMRITRDPDVFLASDLALRRGATRLGITGGQRAVTEYGHRFAPWRSYASMHLWRLGS